jgi:hypothetical protein
VLRAINIGSPRELMFLGAQKSFWTPDGGTGSRRLGGSRNSRPRVRSHCRFSNRGTEYVSESGMKWVSGSAKQECDRALSRPRG